MLRGVVVRQLGLLGDHSVLSEIFLRTVEGCSEPPQQSAVFHGRHIKAGGEKNA